MNVSITSQSNGKDPASTLGFTDDQSNAYNSLIDFINKPYNENDCKRALTGPAGTGKTYLVKALIKNCNLSYSQIGLAAPTHKACRVLQESIGISNVKTNTLQSDLGLRLNLMLRSLILIILLLILKVELSLEIIKFILLMKLL